VTLQQGLSFGLIGATVLCFLWGRWRYDLVALCALAVGVASGLIPIKSAFDGFSNDIVVIIASALVLSAAISRSGLVENLMAPLLPHLKDERTQVPVLATATTLLSMVTKNVGALALMMPSALRIARNTGVSSGRLLMPMSFGSLVGGLAVLVGTSPNIIVSEVRQDALGKPFAMFDFMPVGGTLSVLAILYLSFAYRLLPRGRAAAIDIDAALAANAYVTEVEIPEGWALGRGRVADLRKTAGEAVAVVALLRGRKRIASPHPNRKLSPGDVLLLEGQQQEPNELIVKAKLKLTDADRPVVMEEPTDEVRVRLILSRTREEAAAVIGVLAQGAAFEAVAAQSSIDDATRFSGGDLGYRTLDVLPKAYADALRDQPAGSTIGPVQTEAGWAVLRVEDRRRETPPTLEQARPQFVRFLTYEGIRQQLEQLRGRAKIERMIGEPEAAPSSAPAGPAQ